MLTRHLYINGIDAVSQPDRVCVNLTKTGYDALNAIVYIIAKTVDGGIVSWRDVDTGEKSVTIENVDELLRNPALAILYIENNNK